MMHKYGIAIHTNGLIYGRPDFRGLWHETVKEYLARGGIIKRTFSIGEEYQGKGGKNHVRNRKDWAKTK